MCFMDVTIPNFRNRSSCSTSRSGELCSPARHTLRWRARRPPRTRGATTRCSAWRAPRATPRSRRRPQAGAQVAPDKNATGSNATEVFKRIQEAQSVLSDKHERASTTRTASRSCAAAAAAAAAATRRRRRRRRRRPRPGRPDRAALRALLGARVEGLRRRRRRFYGVMGALFDEIDARARRAREQMPNPPKVSAAGRPRRAAFGARTRPRPT